MTAVRISEAVREPFGEQPKGFCQCGCGRRTKIASRASTRNGWIKGEPVRYIHGHRGKPIAERFWARANKNGPISATRPDLGPCWLWTSTITGAGYGLIGVDGKRRYAHRISYELLVGPIPQGLELDHLCRTTACVNPDHLEPVTHRENIRRSKPATKTHCVHGHLYDEENTYLDRRGCRFCRECKRASDARYRSTR